MCVLAAWFFCAAARPKSRRRPEADDEPAAPAATHAALARPAAPSRAGAGAAQGGGVVTERRRPDHARQSRRDGCPEGPVHPHPITPQHQRIYAENRLIGGLNGAMDVKDVPAMRRFLEQYRREYPEDERDAAGRVRRDRRLLRAPGRQPRAAAERWVGDAQRLDAEAFRQPPLPGAASQSVRLRKGSSGARRRRASSPATSAASVGS